MRPSLALRGSGHRPQGPRAPYLTRLRAPDWLKVEHGRDDRRGHQARWAGATRFLIRPSAESGAAFFSLLDRRGAADDGVDLDLDDKLGAD